MLDGGIMIPIKSRPKKIYRFDGAKLEVHSLNEKTCSPEVESRTMWRCRHKYSTAEDFYGFGFKSDAIKEREKELMASCHVANLQLVKFKKKYHSGSFDEAGRM